MRHKEETMCQTCHRHMSFAMKEYLRYQYAKQEAKKKGQKLKVVRPSRKKEKPDPSDWGGYMDR